MIAPGTDCKDLRQAMSGSQYRCGNGSLALERLQHSETGSRVQMNYSV
jgi:hypothetical protein